MTPEWRAGRALDAPAFDAVIRRSVFDCCRWSVGAWSSPTLARFPILISRRAFNALASLAEQLAAEALAAEAELLERRDLHARLGLPPEVAHLLTRAVLSTAPRFLRVDFHPTPQGYRITEANSDVAGGFIEGSGVAALWPHDEGVPAGDPAGELAQAFVRQCGRGATVGMLHFSRYTEDRQVVAYLGRRFDAAGLRSVLFDARDLRPGLRTRTHQLDALFRFVPGEWLAELPEHSDWPQLFTSRSTSNPLSTMLTQSKRAPLLWPQLETSMSTWRALTPQVHSPEAVDWDAHEFVLKPAFGHEGFGVTLPGISTPEFVRCVHEQVARAPGDWVAQHRFELIPTTTPDGPRFVCTGVYVVDGRAAGAYARVSCTPVINEHAQDAVVLLEDS